MFSAHVPGDKASRKEEHDADQEAGQGKAGKGARVIKNPEGGREDQSQNGRIGGDRMILEIRKMPSTAPIPKGTKSLHWDRTAERSPARSPSMKVVMELITP